MKSSDKRTYKNAHPSSHYELRSFYSNFYEICYKGFKLSQCIGLYCLHVTDKSQNVFLNRLCSNHGNSLIQNWCRRISILTYMTVRSFRFLSYLQIPIKIFLKSLMLHIENYFKICAVQRAKPFCYFSHNQDNYRLKCLSIRKQFRIRK